MNFENVEKSVMLCMASRKTPVVVSSRGLGKTSMMKNIADKLGMNVVVVDGNLLKEGELGGLPIPYKNDNGVMVTNYAIHSKLRLVDEYCSSGKSVLLFIDEINRTTRETMAEMMNLILNREINGYKLPENVFIVAAMNPSSTTKGFEGDSSYGVTEMDAASKNRLVWLYLDMDPKSWLSWATDRPIENLQKDEEAEIEEIELEMFDMSLYDTMIEQDIIEFIANTPNMLNTDREDLDACASPRTWSFVSDILRTYERNKKVFNSTHLDACIKGCIGDEAYIQFMQFVQNNDNPLIKPEDFWAGKEINKDLLERFENDTLPRQMIQAKNIARFVSEKSRLTAKDAERLSTIYALMPIDILLITMRYIKDQFLPLHKKLLDNSSYLALYRNATKLAS